MPIPQRIKSLTSHSNPRIKEVVKLRKPGYRKALNLFIIEGLREVSLALNAAIDIKEIYLCPEYLDRRAEDSLIVKTKEKGIAIIRVGSKVYDHIAFGNRQEGIIAIAVEPQANLSDIKIKVSPLIVILEHLEKPGNLGAVIRSADAAGIDAVVCVDARVDIYNPNVVRSSLGTLFSVKVIRADAQEVLSWLKINNITIVCAAVQAELAYTSMDFRGPAAIVLGSEEKGLSALWKDNSDYQVCIPMAGSADSLNVSVAAGVLLFEAVRQRKA